MPIIYTFEFGNLREYFADRRRVWNTLETVQARHPDRQFYAVWNMDYAAELITPTELLAHKDFMTQLRNTSGKVGSNLITDMLSDDIDQSDSAFCLSICSCESTVTNARVNGLRAHVRRGFLSSVTNCVLKGLWKQCLYYKANGEQRPSAWGPDGLPLPENEIKLNANQKAYRKRIANFVKEYEEGAGRSSDSLVKDGLNDRDLPRLAVATNTQITVWVQHAGSYIRRHMCMPTVTNSHHYMKAHFLLSRPDHVDILLPDNVSDETRNEMIGRMDIQYVPSERLLAIASKTDEETTDDIVFIVKGNPGILTKPYTVYQDTRFGNRHEDVVLQVGNAIYKHENLENEVEARLGTHAAHDHVADLCNALKKANIHKINETRDRRAYRAVMLADQVWGHKMYLPTDAEEGALAHTYDFRKFYSTEFGDLSEESFPYFHGYPANPNLHEFSGPIGNANARCQPFTFRRDKFAVFRLYYISVEGASQHVRQMLADAGLFQIPYGTYYVSSPVVHWLQDHGALWQADYAWLCYATTHHWCPDQELLENMRESKTYGLAIGMLHSGRKPTSESVAICCNRQDAADLAMMYRQEFTNEKAMRINGFDRFFAGEEVVLDSGLRAEAQRMVAEVRERRAQTTRPTQRRRVQVEGQSNLDLFMSGETAVPQQEEEHGPTHEVPLCASSLRPVTNSGIRPLAALKVLPLRMRGSQVDPDEPHVSLNTRYRYGERSDYGYIVCAHHGYCVTRMLQAMDAVGDASAIMGYSLDAIHTTRDFTPELVAAGLLKEEEEAYGFFRPAITKPISECKHINMGDAILSNHVFTSERLMEQVDPTLAPKPDQPAYTAETDAMRQLNVVTGRPGTGKTTGFFRLHEGSEQRLPQGTTVLATPTNLLAADFSNKFGCETLTLHRATKYPVGSFPGPPAERFQSQVNAGAQNATVKNNLWCEGTFCINSNCPQAQTIVVDEVTQHSYSIIRDCIDVAKANHLQLVMCGDLCMETGRIYQMGPVEPMANFDNSVRALQEESESMHHIKRQRVYRQLGDAELQTVLDRLREETDEEGTRILMSTQWVRNITGAQWRDEVVPRRDLSITPLHRVIDHITRNMLDRMTDADLFKVQACAKLDVGDHRPDWFSRFLVEFGIDPSSEQEVQKGMTATVSKAEWRAMMDRPVYNQRYVRGTRPGRGVLVYNDRDYSWKQTAQMGGNQLVVPINKVNPLIVSTAHTVQGREVGEDGTVYVMYHPRMAGMGGWNEDFAYNSVYVAASRIRKRQQLVMVDISDIAP